MKVLKLIRKRIRHTSDGVDVVGNVSAAVSANVNEPAPSHTHVSSRHRIVQRAGRTEKHDDEPTTKGGE